MTSAHKDFKYRHIGTSASDQQHMLQSLGYESLDALMSDAVPQVIRFNGEGTLPEPISEPEALGELRALAARNRITASMIGLGYYGTHVPGVIKRNVLENPSWYTAYTPYQPEISQGRLEALINFQTMVTDLTGMKTANASMLDEGTAVVEAMMIARRSSDSKSNVFFVDSDALPQTKALLEHRAEPLDIEVRYFDAAKGSDELTGEYFGLMLQYPGASGAITEIKPAIDAAHAASAIAVVAADLLSLTLIASPGDLGADIAVGTSQRFGVPMGFGGPHAGYLAVRDGLERSMPGRLVGVSIDAEGAAAYRLTLQTREQHIRRERATSNICTAQVLLAVMAGMYAVYHGPRGLRAIANEVHIKAVALAESLTAAGLTLSSQEFFDTIRVLNVDAEAVWQKARAHGITMLKVDASTIGISVDETTSEATLNAIAHAFGAELVSLTDSSRVSNFARNTSYLTHEVFNSHHSETSMLRYLKRLADYDYALDRGMIPLGSCTMKLNSTTEMEAVTWPEFGNIHPFAPADDTRGYLQMIDQLTSWLCEVTGYDAVSLQPNAGSQGELAGLMAIRGYHLSRGDVQRTVCLIPSSAHGTNAASAVLAGMQVVVVACDENGNVDVADLTSKIDEAGDRLSALMVTYPSTHGVYEEAIVDICDRVHAAGGQVYIDGANTNAVVGYAKFGKFGGDVSHLNLHKTFCIPHGGGGPGVGPVAARAHLAPFLPGHGQAQTELPAFGPISAAPYGSASILPISWAYIRMMGNVGLAEATATAVLAANYVAKKLEGHYPVLYTGNKGLVAHECILDVRPLTKDSGVSVDDIAKRLIDYGFHAPTMSFPVAGTLMIEPTESEPLEELDRFVDAMIAIRAEAAKVESGEWNVEDNPLRNAPHTAKSVIGEWNKPYSRELAAYPVVGQHRNKYWPIVRRIDSVYGDRNLVCSCPPPEAFA
ncbi:MAG: aminomethyl-transferring glycine dehydrogenase [Actinomycetota bacterium]|jgi:glycine dehydrogenase